jgi:hypothetical protein
MRGAVLSLVFTCVAGLLVAAPAHAALKVTPSRTVLTGKPGQLLVGYYLLENVGEDAEPVDVTIEPEDWAEGMGGERKPPEWLKVLPKELQVKPGKQVKVKYWIRVPHDASGELRTQVFFTSTTSTEKAGATIRARLGVIIYLGIEGTQQFAATIKQVEGFYQASTPGVPKPDRLSLAIKLWNGGNAHIAPEGDVLVRNEKKETVARFRLRGGWGLLPKETNTYQAIGEGVYLKPGRYSFYITINYGGDLLHPDTVGKIIEGEITEDYQVHLVGEDSQPDSSHPSVQPPR